MTTLANWLADTGITDNDASLVGSNHFFSFDWDELVREDHNNNLWWITERLTAQIYFWENSIIHIPNIQSIVNSAAHVFSRRADMQTQNGRLFRRFKIRYTHDESLFRFVEVIFDTVEVPHREGVFVSTIKHREIVHAALCTALDNAATRLDRKWSRRNPRVVRVTNTIQLPTRALVLSTH